jgi:hypothetical protein
MFAYNTNKCSYSEAGILKMKKYVGQTIEMIYLDRHNRFGQRRVRIKSVDDLIVRAYCLEQRGPRVFRVENILAMQPVKIA